jgi:hypothetical protein
MPEEKTKVMIVTACRSYLGQTVIEVPLWLSEQRVRGIIRHGGALASYFARNVRFDRIQGTGLANCVVTDWRPNWHPEYREAPQPEHKFGDISDALRVDGLIF